MQGLMTYLLTKTVKENPEITYGGILIKIHEEIAKIQQKQCHPRLLQHVFQHKIA